MQLSLWLRHRYSEYCRFIAAKLEAFLAGDVAVEATRRLLKNHTRFKLCVAHFRHAVTRWALHGKSLQGLTAAGTLLQVAADRASCIHHARVLPARLPWPACQPTHHASWWTASGLPVLCMPSMQAAMQSFSHSATCIICLSAQQLCGTAPSQAKAEVS